MGWLKSTWGFVRRRYRRPQLICRGQKSNTLSWCSKCITFSWGCTSCWSIGKTSICSCWTKHGVGWDTKTIWCVLNWPEYATMCRISSRRYQKIKAMTMSLSIKTSSNIFLELLMSSIKTQWLSRKTIMQNKSINLQMWQSSLVKT